MGLTELTGVTGAMLKLALDAASVRHMVIANNIANANTPDFVPSRVEFEEHLAAAAAREGAYGARLTRPVSPVIVSDPQALDPLQARVQIDLEVAKLAQNTLQYQVLTRAVRARLDMLQTAIGAGGNS